MKNMFEKLETSFVNAAGDKTPVRVSSLISQVDFQNAVTSIEEIVFPDGTYSPEIFDIALWTVVINAYSDIDVEGYSDDELLAEIFSTRPNSLPLILSATINSDQFSALETAARDRIAVRKTKSQFDLLCQDVRKMLTKYDAVLEKVITEKNGKRLLGKISKLLTSGDLATLLKQIEKGAALM